MRKNKDILDEDNSILLRDVQEEISTNVEHEQWWSLDRRTQVFGWFGTVFAFRCVGSSSRCRLAGHQRGRSEADGCVATAGEVEGVRVKTQTCVSHKATKNTEEPNVRKISL